MPLPWLLCADALGIQDAAASQSQPLCARGVRESSSPLQRNLQPAREHA